MVRRWEANPDANYPIRIAVIELDGKRWTADNCYIGGDPEDGRILEAALVGLDAALFSTLGKLALTNSTEPVRTTVIYSPQYKGFLQMWFRARE